MIEINFYWKRILLLSLLLFSIVGIAFVQLYSNQFIGEEKGFALFSQQLLQNGQLYFREAGFQGATLAGLPLAIIGINHSFIIINLLGNILSIGLIYILIQKIYKNENYAYIGVLLYCLMPWILFNGLKGYTNGFYHFTLLLTLYLLTTNSKWTLLAFTFSLLTKPLSIVLLPIFFKQKKMKTYFLGLGILIVYLTIQQLVNGDVVIGVHKSMDASNFFSITRSFINIFTIPPLLFSMHNFLAFSPELTTYSDMLETTPIIIYAAIFSSAYLKETKSNPFYGAFLLSSIGSVIITIFWPYINTVYLETFIFFAVIFSVPFLIKYPLFGWLAIGTSLYQYLYFFLQEKVLGFNIWGDKTYIIFIIPIVVTILFIEWQIKQLNSAGKIPKIW